MASDESGPFSRIPWCRAIIDDPGFKATTARIQKYPRHNPFWFEVVRKDLAVRAHCLLYRTPHDTIAESEMETRELIDFGFEVIGQRGICHGGFLATIVDEAAGAFLRVYELDNSRDPRTAYLNITYKKVVTAPGIVLVTTKFLSKDGRKMRLEVVFKDAQGDTCLVAEILYSTRRPGAL